ncbi:MAG: helix-turn-helix transcriptional regulator [Loktanella sp.]|nr:helix-turn-helix transcriptional regulator [Loktanella sp.]
MDQTEPHFVDRCKTTICELHENDVFVKSTLMTNQDAPHKDIADRLVAIREGFSDLNQKQWAVKHGFTVTQWNNWEGGIRRITVESAERLCALYGLTLDFIYLGRRDGLSDSASKVL